MIDRDGKRLVVAISRGKPQLRLVRLAPSASSRVQLGSPRPQPRKDALAHVKSQARNVALHEEKPRQAGGRGLDGRQLVRSLHIHLDELPSVPAHWDLLDRYDCDGIVPIPKD